MAGQGLALWRSPRRGPASWAWPSTEPDEAGDPGHVATRRYKAGLAWPGWESGTLPCRALACPRRLARPSPSPSQGDNGVQRAWDA